MNALKLILLAGALILPVTTAQSYDRSVRVCNRASVRIIHVYATHIDREDYGRDLLVGNIPVGQCRTIDPGYSEGYCVFDWRAVLANGDYATGRFDTCKAETWTIHD